jgi:hypothetical protein
MACLETKGCGRHDVYRPGLSYIFPEQGLFTYAIRLLFIYQHMHFASRCVVMLMLACK